MLMKKKQLLMATLVIALGAAVAVNWYYTKNPIEINQNETQQTQQEHQLGESISVDAQQQEAAQSVMADANFFTNERMKRDEAYGEIGDTIEDLAEKDSLTKEESDKIYQLLDRYAHSMKVQSDTESLISAKTGSDCIVVINDEVCQVIMEKNSLNDAVILQITEIIEKNTNISAKKLTIIEAN